MNRTSTSFAAAALVLSLFAASSACAQEHAHEGHGAPTAQPAASAASDATAAGEAAPSSQDWIPAELRRVDAAQQKLTLKHGDIRHLDMPGMTMPFRLAPGVVSAAQLSGMKVGDRLEVRIASLQGQPVIVALRPAAAE